MSRRLIFIALLLSMLMQATSLGHLSAGVGSGQTALHALLHWAGLGHHHGRHHPPATPDTRGTTELADIDATGGLRVSAVVDTASDICNQDQSPESTQHLLMDGFVGSAAMIPSWPASLPAQPPHPALPCAHAERVPPTPFLAGLRRPPRPTA